MSQKLLYVVTGLSGAGKSTALRAFEDLGFFTVDGLPASLAPDMAAMLEKPAMRHFVGMAMGMDLRETDFLASFNAILAELASSGVQAKVIFLDASDDELMRRYAQTRRPHPLERQGLALAGAVAAERKLLADLKARADLRIDTTGFTIYDLKRAIRARHGRNGAVSLLRVIVVSFGFKYGIPEDADFVFDARFLPNPFFVDKLKPLSGLSEAVSSYVFANGMAGEFLDKIRGLLDFVLPRLEADGRMRVTVAIGCTGGRHRSVALAAMLASQLRGNGYEILVEHRNIDDDAPVAARHAG